jgi:hypothetical protein
MRRWLGGASTAGTSPMGRRYSEDAAEIRRASGYVHFKDVDRKILRHHFKSDGVSTVL